MKPRISVGKHISSSQRKKNKKFNIKTKTLFILRTKKEWGLTMLKETRSRLRTERGGEITCSSSERGRRRNEGMK